MADVELGYVSGVFGVRGEVRVFLHNPESELLESACDVWLVTPDGARRAVLLTCRSGAGRRILGAIDGLTDPAEARALQGHRIVVPEADLPSPDEGEFYVRDVEGAEVRIDGARVGTVTRVHAAGAVDILEIDTGGAEPAFVPAVQDFVQAIGPDGVVLSAGALLRD